jgi:dihydroorotate dehydrogenase electron transfer subunit
MFDETVTIVENKKINAGYLKLVFKSRKLSRGVLPGQFLNLQIEPYLDPLLRRPFSYYRVQKDCIEVLYENLGRGTALLAQKQAGQTLRALGPLGLSFTQNLKAKKRVLVAGGVGVPPLVFLAEHIQKELKTPLLMIGCKSKKEVLPKRELARVKSEVQYATDDGSYGSRGLVTVLLEKLLRKEDPKTLFIQTCGPRGMMNTVIQMAREHDVEGEASIDERMACGVGACLGCVVETIDGFKTSCIEGPVFRFSSLV